MKITADSLHQKWDTISFYDGGYVLVENTASLEWHIGYKEINQKSLLLITEIEPDSLPSSKSIIVSKGKRTDGRWTLAFTIVRIEQENVFETLCADLIVHSMLDSNERDAVSSIAKRYKQWYKLLEYQKSSMMDENSRKGLLGELIFLSEMLSIRSPELSVIQGWAGPDGGDQDFAYADSWYEIKSVGIASESVTISSLEQLDNDGPGDLVVIRLDKCVPEKNGAISLLRQVNLVMERLWDDEDALALFEHKLAKYGYIDLPEYDEQKYIYSGRQIYGVTAAFPRLVKDNVPSAVCSAHYAIDLCAIEQYLKENL